MFPRTQLLISTLFAVSSVLGVPSVERREEVLNLANFRIGAFKVAGDTTLNPNPYGFPLVLDTVKNEGPIETLTLVVSTLLHPFDTDKLRN